MRKVAVLGFALAALVFASGVQALTITGTGEATRSYAFRLDGHEVFVLGVDSVEERQSCTINRQPWDCWAPAIRSLQQILFEGGEVTCETITEPDEDQRVLATCTTVHGDDLGLLMIESGFAVALRRETTRYNDAEQAARDARIGLWQGEFAPPAIWRARPMSPPSERPRFPFDEPLP
ncbi:MAG: thermonuclease family protein [Bauldia sp.]|nr:thermonuclease family protein [Bauldia sp.]